MTTDHPNTPIPGNELALQQQISKTSAYAAEQHNLYVHAATANNTRQAYQTDIAHIEAWGGVCCLI